MNQEISMIDKNTAYFDGCIFKRIENGRHANYFRCQGHNKKHSGRTLHAAVFITCSGIVPVKGYAIHHIDHNRLNNSFDNLRLMTTSDHIKLHNDTEPQRIANACFAAAIKNRELGYANVKKAVEASRQKGWPGAKAMIQKRGIKVMSICHETGERNTYNSVREAARKTGISKTSISNCLSGKYDAIKGFSFKEVSGK